jgi:branched-chain amino acid aminotransferase
MKIYVNGIFIDNEQPSILASDRGFLLGDGIFTTLKTVGTHLVHFSAHYQRLSHNAQFIKLPFNYTEGGLNQICQKLIEINDLANDVLVIRISLTRGKSQRGIDIPDICHPTIVISAAKSSLIPAQPISLLLSSFTRNECSPIISIKAPNYLESILARQEAKDLLFNDGLLSNTKGNICETSTANIFFFRDGRLYTPQKSDGILPGVTRKFVISLAESAGLEVLQNTISKNDIHTFEQCFITNCAVGIQEVNKINEFKFSNNAIVSQLQSQYFSKLSSS